MTKETFTFQAEVGKLLDIVAHSLYSHKEIFLRELISNASDACDRLRYEALTKPALLKNDGSFRIELSADAKKKTLTVSDNGIGMNRDDLTETLGTIARSGTQAFIDGMKEGKENGMALIGQFGVGFYSSFMVAKKVEVLTWKAGEEKAWIWVSDGQGSFTIEAAERSEHGTTITLYLKKDEKEYLEEQRLATIVTTYSDHIGIPIVFLSGEGKEEKTLNAASALWTRQKAGITQDQYKEFYHHVSHAFDDPWMTLHNQVEGVVSYTNLLFIPSSQPFDLFQPERKQHVKLYVNKVFITDDCEGLLPSYLRFLKGVVDSPDLPLNISREMFQHDPKLAKIRTGLVKRTLAELKKKADKKPEDYAEFWENFGPVLKEGIYEDVANREKILALSRFASTDSDKLTSLDAYAKRMKEGQEAIYYITGENPEQVARSPQLEGFRSRGIEVLLLSDPIDEFWIPSIGDFKEKAFKSVTKGSADLDKVGEVESKKDKKKKKINADIDPLIAAFKAALGDAVKDVTVSSRLTDSPVCLVAGEGDMDMYLERMMKKHSQRGAGMTAARVLEINPAHPLIERLGAVLKDAGDETVIEDAAHLLLDQARIAEGEPVPDPVA
ncbi:MAG TPA: molecular chaperone HtpG, partial [Rhodospirillales bacterium]|nr:molecular chaperone HtpG [Rhodospirillales bacterium]